jgi:hypothetical protein
MRTLLNSLILLHYFVFLAMVVSIPMVILYQPWYLAVVIITIIVRIVASPNPCPLSMLEVNVQRKLGLPEKPLFLKHHVMVDFPLIKTLYD